MVTTIHERLRKTELHNPIKLLKFPFKTAFISLHGKRTSYGIRAIIEAIQAGTTVDKVYIQKEGAAN
jgi:hypothetical protein